MHSIHYLANKAQWLIQCVIFRKGKFKLYDSQNSAQTPKMSRGENSNGNSANISNKEKRFSNHTAFRRCFAICFGFLAERQNANWSLPEEKKSYIALLSTASAKGGRQ